jgi:hypothetical protein
MGRQCLSLGAPGSEVVARPERGTAGVPRLDLAVPAFGYKNHLGMTAGIA